MVDTRMSLTFTVRNNPGRYALLLGSGTSTEAGIPTGWDVVSSLIKRVAAIDGESIDDDTNLTDWYKDNYEERATYENLIGGIAKNQTERRSLLEGFFEPTNEEANRDEKTPTDAHQSIAWLVDNDYIDVILTTNFDQLLEEALRDQGVNPVVISGEESARGAEPLGQQDAVVVKVNGDYKETNIKNLSSELETYSEPMQKIIDRVFQEYGLIVCGWSGKHDTRLRQSLQECETHRYSTFWTHYSELGDVASELVAHRDGFTIKNEGATSFFTDLRDRVQALEGAEEGEPLTTAVARERVKRYLPREEHKIDLADLVGETAQRVSEEVHDQDRFPLKSEKLDDDFSVQDRCQDYGAIMRPLLVEVMTCEYWGEDTANSGKNPVSDAISMVTPSHSPDRTWTTLLNDLRRYPATLAMYSAGIAGMAADNWDLVSSLVTHPIEMPRSSQDVPVNHLHPRRLTGAVGRGFDRGSAEKELRTAMKGTIQELAMEFFNSESSYERAFENFEVLFDVMWYAETDGDHIVSLGTTYWGEGIERVEKQIEEQQDEWPPIRTGVLDLSNDEVVEILEDVRDDFR
ncbi:hypothetical protein DMJ13_23105 [halophilic archaeon]|nr:hypothetical protein DMJ13_23105 [halophilic archaeon]